MTRRLEFSKLSGAGNDFIFVPGPVPAARARALARRLTARREGVGADGLLIAARDRVEHYNADGSRTFCGNGARCAAWELARRGWAGREHSFTLSGVRVRAVVGRGAARLSMPDVAPPRTLSFSAAGRRMRAVFLDTGVPHAVVEVTPAALAALDIAVLGPAVRRHPVFGRPGANADFVAPARGGLRLRTWERGVEDETLACGTGAVAAALALGKSPCRVSVRGGLLTVSFAARPDGGFTDVRLEGPVRLTFTGEVTL
ncbi:MAG: diaminopimelate epimerase [Elusimicrobia bacterium]|nr:diaminopimelate epimerase [Elusimicrobiota bacterium]